MSFLVLTSMLTSVRNAGLSEVEELKLRMLYDGAFHPHPSTTESKLPAYHNNGARVPSQPFPKFRVYREALPDYIEASLHNTQNPQLWSNNGARTCKGKVKAHFQHVRRHHIFFLGWVLWMKEHGQPLPFPESIVASGENDDDEISDSDEEDVKVTAEDRIRALEAKVALLEKQQQASEGGPLNKKQRLESPAPLQLDIGASASPASGQHTETLKKQGYQSQPRLQLTGRERLIALQMKQQQQQQTLIPDPASASSASQTVQQN